MEGIQGDMDKKNRQIETLQKDLTAQIAENEKTNKMYAKQLEESYTNYKTLQRTVRDKEQDWEDRFLQKEREFKEREDEFIRIEAIYKAAPGGIYRGGRYDDRTDRHRGPDGPCTPKMSTFDGKTDWRPFHIQFVYIATRYKWTNEQKLDKLIECLRDRALKYFSTRPDVEKQNFETLCQKMNERFGKKDLPHIVRRQLQDVRHDTGETLEEFEERVRDMAVDGYPNMSDVCIQTVAVDAFLKGCNNKQAALTAMDKNPTTLDEARQHLKSAITNQKLILGAKKSEIKRVTFQNETSDSDSETEETVAQIRSVQESKNKREISIESRISGIEQQVKNIEENHRDTKTSINQILNILKSQGVPLSQRSRSNSSEQQNRTNTRSSSQSPNRYECFNCGKESHFARECPTKRERYRSPSPQYQNRRSLNYNRSEK